MAGSSMQPQMQQPAIDPFQQMMQSMGVGVGAPQQQPQPQPQQTPIHQQPKKREFIPHKPCMYFLKGLCTKGDACTFAHRGATEQEEQNMPACRFFQLNM